MDKGIIMEVPEFLMEVIVTGIMDKQLPESLIIVWKLILEVWSNL